MKGRGYAVCITETTGDIPGPVRVAYATSCVKDAENYVKFLDDLVAEMASENIHLEVYIQETLIQETCKCN